MVTAMTMKGNTVVTYDGTVLGGLRSVSIQQTQSTWDSTANDTTTAKTHLGLWSDGTASMGGVFDPDDAGQIKCIDGSADATGRELKIVFRDESAPDLEEDKYTATCFLTEFSVEGDHEGGWSWSATFQKTGDAVWQAGTVL